MNLSLNPSCSCRGKGVNPSITGGLFISNGIGGGEPILDVCSCATVGVAAAMTVVGVGV